MRKDVEKAFKILHWSTCIGIVSGAILSFCSANWLWLLIAAMAIEIATAKMEKYYK